MSKFCHECGLHVVQPCAYKECPVGSAEPTELVRLRGQFATAVRILRDCLAPLEVSAALIESDDGEQMEELIERVRLFVKNATHGVEVPRGND